MAREFSNELQASTGAKFTEPVYLLKQDMGGSILYSSNREQILWLGDIYLATTGLQVHGLDRDAVSWSLDNSNRATSVLALSNDVGGNAVTVWLYYADSGKAVKRFTGILDAWETVGQRVAFEATSQAAKSQKFPGDRIEKGVFNHLPAPGTALRWGQEILILESERN